MNRTGSAAYTCKIKRLVSLCCISFALYFSQSQLLADDQSNKVELTQKELKKVAKAISKLRDQLGEDKSFQKKEQLALKKIETELGDLNKKSLTLKKEQRDVKDNISKLKRQESTLSEKNKNQKKALNQDLRSIYKIGKQEKLKLLLNQENPEDLARILKYYDYYTDARIQRIFDFQNNLKALALKQSEIYEKLEQLTKIEQELASKTITLAKKQNVRKTVLNELNSEIATKDQQLSALKNDQTRLGKLLQSLKGIWGDIPSKLSKAPLKKLKGKLSRPVAGKVKHAFGSQRVDGRLEWNGWLIGAPANKPVKVIHDGRVVFADWIRGYGLLIIVDHNDGYLSLYGHNASLLKEAGDWLRAGDTLATVGNSGGQYENGLYFELRHDGRPLDPKPWLKKR